MAGTLSTLSIISFVIAGCSFIAAVALGILFKIPNVIGDLNGKNAQKSIANMRAANEKSGKKTYKTSETNSNRGKLTETMSGITAKKTEPQPQSKPQPHSKLQPAPDDNEMVETGLLEENRADNLSESTELLDNPDDTVLLDETLQTAARSVARAEITMLEEVMLIHTEEVIE